MPPTCWPAPQSRHTVFVGSATNEAVSAVWRHVPALLNFHQSESGGPGGGKGSMSGGGPAVLKSIVISQPLTDGRSSPRTNDPTSTSTPEFVSHANERFENPVPSPKQ